jgi:hypothetical protein
MRPKSKSSYPLIRNRTLDSPFSVTNFLGKTGITLEVKASLDDFHKLFDHLIRLSDKEKVDFANQFYLSFVSPYYGWLSKREFKTETYFMECMRIQAAVLHILFHYCFRYLRKNLPRCVRKLIRTNPSLQNRQGKPDAAAYTAYCMQSVYASFIQQFKLNPFFGSEDPDNYQDPRSFRETYIQGGRKLLKKGIRERWTILDRIDKHILPLVAMEKSCTDEHAYDLTYKVLRVLLPYDPFFVEDEDSRALRKIFNAQLPDTL